MHHSLLENDSFSGGLVGGLVGTIIGTVIQGAAYVLIYYLVKRYYLDGKQAKCMYLIYYHICSYIRNFKMKRYIDFISQSFHKGCLCECLVKVSEKKCHN